ncbi:hypothetical protein L2Y94_13210 [Luteibacter aegosomatis]|uniref:hypothetical protein n=1 Tax=Luteibacter aegosomatis TaxID=2911537 RepID=UPI001FFBAAA9|nr:hypothetical protein [Luteibacter aegosomatis]UPG84302.1 hypothetical protein L2Y94_13210 [Luteibacter aegosomatis]
MHSVLASFPHRLAIMVLVVVALFVACAGVRAMPCDANDGMPVVQQVANESDHDEADPVSLPSLEDNTTSLDDTFDVPPHHVVTVPRSAPSRPSGHEPASVAHRLHLDLRPPIV